MTNPPQIPNRPQAPQQQSVQVDQESARLFQLGLMHHQQGQFVPAKAAYEQVLALNPNHFDALHMMGILASQTLNPALADVLIGKALDINPNSARAHANRSHVLIELKRPADALASCDKAIALKPDYADAFSNRGIALYMLSRHSEALASYDQAIALKPNYPEAFNNRGMALKELNRLQEATASYDLAIALKPDYADAFNNRGMALKESKQLDEAVASFDKAIALNPRHADAFNNRGIALKELKRTEQAVASYDLAIAIKPNFAEAFNNRGNALIELNRLDEAVASFDKALALKPDYDFLPGTKLHTQMYLCDWKDLHQQIASLEAAVAMGKRATTPFALLGLSDRPDIQLMASTLCAQTQHTTRGMLDEFKVRTAGEKIRIGYYSADFHNHATSFLVAELFEAHDAAHFELYGFSFGPNKQDEMRQRVAGDFDQFFDVTQKSDRDVAQLSRELGIDIAVDLKGFTQDARLGIFAEQCAPVQINFLGYPGTVGAPYFDYIIADKTLIPEESRRFYSEKIIYLPHSYQVNDSQRKISPRVFTRQDLGLPEKAFVFCCFNNNYKILPATFDVWMRLLNSVDASVLWLLQDNPTAAKNLRHEAEIRGVDPARLVFAPRMKLEDHLARHRAADLFLDTLPCNAHTTASDALWAGCPVLTQMGNSFAARVAASLLNAMDLPELITTTQIDYENRAIELANDREQLAAIKAKIEKNRLTSSLFNGQLFARHIEAAYTEVHTRRLKGAQPDHIDIAALGPLL